MCCDVFEFVGLCWLVVVFVLAWFVMLRVVVWWCGSWCIVWCVGVGVCVVLC